MVKAKGLYEWRLINADTGNIDLEGSQWNLVNERMTFLLCYPSFAYTPLVCFGGMGGYIQLSSTIPTPGVDYRVFGSSDSFTILAEGDATPTNDFVLNKKTFEYNFPIPGSPLTVNTIGLAVKYRNGYSTYTKYGNFTSFINLSSPITQNTNQYLFIRYTLFLEYNPSGSNVNVPLNDYVINQIGSNLLNGTPLRIGYDLLASVTTFLPPVDVNNMMLAVTGVSTMTPVVNPLVIDNSTLASVSMQKSYAVADIPGPIGTVVFGESDYVAYDGSLAGFYFNAAHGYSTGTYLVPSISRIFIHPASRYAQIFSDPAYPPSSNGSLAITGTPSNTFNYVGKLKITSTGEANDTPDAHTGKFKLQVYPFFGVTTLTHLSMGVDFNGGAQLASAIPSVLSPVTIGSFVYSIQRSGIDSIYNICKWQSNTVESSIAVATFGSNSTTYTASVAVGTVLYISTLSGIYKFDTAVPATAPTLLTITGIINSVIYDIAYDSVTGYLWSGHTTGICKIDLGTLVATPHTRTGTLSSLTVDDVVICTGTLSAYNGRVLRSGSYILTPWTYGYTWVYDDGIGVTKITAAYICYDSCIRKGTNQIVTSSYISSAFSRRVYSVTAGAPGTATLLSSVVFTTYSYSYHTTPQILQINNNYFLAFYVGYSGGYRLGYSILYIDGSNVISTFFSYLTTIVSTTINNYLVYSQTLYPINTGSGTSFLYFQNLILNYMLYAPAEYGWDGANWIFDLVTERSIPTSSFSILDSLTAQFNNAVGKTWDQQFILEELFTFMYSPMAIKDNLQTSIVKARYFYCDARLHEDLVSFVLPSDPVYMVSEHSDPDFKDIDTASYLTFVYNSSDSIYLTQYPIASIVGFSFTNPTASTLTVTESIPNGTPIALTGTLPTALLNYNFETYYVVNQTPTTIQLSASLGGSPITFTTGYSGTYYKLIPPTDNYIIPRCRDRFIFNSGAFGKSLKLTYTYILYT